VALFGADLTDKDRAGGPPPAEPQAFIGPWKPTPHQLSRLWPVQRGGQRPVKKQHSLEFAVTERQYAGVMPYPTTTRRLRIKQTVGATYIKKQKST
jgi:hypothetical protein